jgi:hypothetical protein
MYLGYSKQELIYNVLFGYCSCFLKNKTDSSGNTIIEKYIGFSIAINKKLIKTTGTPISYGKLQKIIGTKMADYGVAGV